MTSDRTTGYKASTLIIACVISFFVGRQMPPANLGYSTCLSAKPMTVPKTAKPDTSKPIHTASNINSKNDTGWSQVDVFYGDSSHLQKRIPPGIKTWTSQARQDELVWLLLNKKVRGFFVDLAANDATYLSNTYTLETFFLWNGLCIEANPKYWNGLASRPRCQVVGAVVGHDTMAKVDFTYKASGESNTINDGGLFGGIVNPDFDNNETNKEGYVTELRYTIPLSDLFARYNVPQAIDYLSLDVEGAESYIMMGFPFDKYTIKILTVERPKQDLKDLLEQIGYVFLDTLSHFGEAIYCHKSVLRKLDFKSAGLEPPSNIVAS